MTFSSTSCLVALPCASRVSATCVPIRATGLRFDMGSCGTRPIDAPRIRRIVCSDAPTSSRPSSWMLPAVTRPLPGSSPMSDIAVVDLPEPDSPTIARVSPAPRSNDTCSTARTGPSSVENSTATSRTRKRGAASPAVAGRSATASSVLISPSCPGPRQTGRARPIRHTPVTRWGCQEASGADARGENLADRAVRGGEQFARPRRVDAGQGAHDRGLELAAGLGE